MVHSRRVEHPPHRGRAEGENQGAGGKAGCPVRCKITMKQGFRILFATALAAVVVRVMIGLGLWLVVKTKWEEI